MATMSKKRKPSFDLHSLLLVEGDEQPHSHSSNNKNNSNSNRIDFSGSSTTITNNISNSGTNDTNNNNSCNGPSAIDHLDALGNAYDEVSISTDSMRHDDHNNNHHHHHHTHVESSNKMAPSSSGRDRAESWGGMSDISATAAVASALHQTGIIDDVTAAAAAMEIPSPTLGPIHPTTGSIASNSGRSRLDSFSDIIRRTDRLESLASLSEFHNQHHYHRPRTQSIASLSEASMTMSMAAVEDLANLANDLEYIIEPNHQTNKHQQQRKLSDASLSNLSLPPPQQPAVISATSKISTAQISSSSKPIAVASNTATKPSTPQTPVPAPAPKPAPAPAPLPSATISVDSDAVKAAVDAAMAVTLTGIFDITALCNSNTSQTAPTNSRKTKTQTKHTKTTATKPVPKPAPKPKSILSKPTMPKPSAHKSSSLAPISKMPTKTTPSSNKRQNNKNNIINNTVILAATNTTAAALRDRARAAAGYIPPTPNKRPKFTALEPPNRLLTPTITTPATPVTKTKPPSTILSSPSSFTTPKRKNTSNNTTSNNATPVSTSKGGQSNQKWDDMLQCLLQYITQQREKETKDMSEGEKKEWTWDGNVPTTYKTKCGKALGRWINNQRSAKNKGTLKQDRETRLVSTGLKWSVLSTNAWPDMMDELRIYVKAKTIDGSKWDGNVPTNYRIKGNTAPDGSEIDEDKNLGRWINRQRSLYQAGKLKKDRQVELEKIGLKWSVLSTTSWHAMYGALCRYADSFVDQSWDGNVPANYRTDDHPPKSLGRWVNRQRSAFAKGKLKQEFVDKLERVGLKWAVHEKKITSHPDDPSDEDNEMRIASMNSKLAAQPLTYAHRPTSTMATTAIMATNTTNTVRSIATPQNKVAFVVSSAPTTFTTLNSTIINGNMNNIKKSTPAMSIQPFPVKSENDPQPFPVQDVNTKQEKAACQV